MIVTGNISLKRRYTFNKSRGIVPRSIFGTFQMPVPLLNDQIIDVVCFNASAGLFRQFVSISWQRFVEFGGTLLAQKIGYLIHLEDTKVRNKLLTVFALAVLAIATGCTQTDTTNANANANANAAPATTTRAAADNSEITTTTDSSGVKTETRVFKNNPRVSKVVVTTDSSGRRTTKVYSPTGTEKVVDNVGDALTETGDAIASAAGWTADKAKEGANEAGDKLEDAKDQTVKGAKEVGDKLEDAKDQTVKGAKTVGKKTEAGAKKAGKAIKDALP